MEINQKTYLISGIAAVIIILVVLFVVKPLFAEIEKTSAMVLSSREKLLALEKTDKDYLEQIENDYKNIEDNLRLIKNGLIEKKDAVDFFKALENVASSTSSKLEINATDFPSLTLNLIGDFSNFMKFLGWLENGEYLIDVNLLNITGTTQREGTETILTGEIKANLKIKVYTK